MKLGDYILDIASGPFGSNLKVDCFVQEGFPIIDGANLKEVRVSDDVTKFVTEEKARSLHRSIAKRMDVVVTISGTLGQISYIPEDSKYEEYLCSQRQFRVTFDASKVDVCYLVYYFHTKEGQKKILSFANYVGVPALSQPIPNFKNIEVDLPPLPEQKRIASVLSALDKKIALNRQINQNLEALARQLYDYWFVQFDFPDANGKPYKSSGGKMVYNPILKREIPEGWEVKKLGDLCTCLLGGTPSREKSEYWGGSINWINSGKINEFRISTPSETITEEGLNHTSTYLLPKGTTVLAITGATLGQVSILNIDACANQSVIGILENDILPTEYIYQLVLRDIPRLLYQQTGAAQPHVNKNDIENIPVIVPQKLDLIKLYYNRVHCLYDTISNIEKNCISLTKQRDELLPLLMNGQVTVE